MIHYHVGKQSRLPTALRSPQLCWRYPHHYFPSFFAKFSLVYSPILSQKQSQVNHHRSELQSLSVGTSLGSRQSFFISVAFGARPGRLRPSLPRFRWSMELVVEPTSGTHREPSSAEQNELRPLTMNWTAEPWFHWSAFEVFWALRNAAVTMPLYRSASDFVVNSAKMLMICLPRCCVFVFEPTVLSEICWMHFLGPDSHCVKICDHCSHHHKAFGLTQVPIQIATKQNVQKLQRWNGLIL